jgi:integrase
VPFPAQEVKNKKPKDKQYKVSDEKGLFMLVHPNGSKYWRMNYRYGGKQKTLSLGVYPEISLAEARTKRDDARKLISNDVDPSAVKRAAKITRHQSSENSFKAIALEWFEQKKTHWSESHCERVDRILSKELLPIVGNRPISEITAPELLACLRRPESRGVLETARRAKQISGQVFRYAIAIGKAERDPSSDLRDALATPIKTHFAAVTNPKEVGQLLITLDDYQGTPEVVTALKLAPLLFCRPKELRHMEWTEINFDKQEWHIPGEKMKTKADHIVPLCTQAIEALQSLLQITGHRQYVFPSARSPKRPMSDNAVLSALRRLGIPKEQMTGHGFRAMARTLLDEELGYRIEWIECQLAHAVKDANGRAYNRTTYLRQRKDMMQHWGDYLNNLKAEALKGNVITGNFGAKI